MVISPALSNGLAVAAATDHMRDRIRRFPIEAQRAWALGREWPIPAGLREPRQVIVCGMGGSAIGGAFLSVAARRALPVHLVRDYSLPPCDADTLVIANSFSGNTEETLAAIQSPEARPAMKLVLSTGGRIADVAPSIGAAVMGYECAGPPRTAWEFGFLSLLALLERLGHTTDQGRDAPGVLEALRECAPALELAAEKLAPRLTDRVPFVVGAEHLAPVARRWAGQLNENAKRVAFFGELPEMSHNFLLGLTDERAEAMTVVLLDSELLSDRARTRLELTEQLLANCGVEHERVLIPGTCELDSMLRGALFGDWVSWWLAVAGGVDPSDSSALENFKTTLAAASR